MHQHGFLDPLSGEDLMDDQEGTEEPVPDLVPDLGSDDEEMGVQTVLISFITEDNGFSLNEVVTRLTQPSYDAAGVSILVLIPKRRIFEVIGALREYMRSARARF